MTKPIRVVGVSGIADAVPVLSESQLAGHRCVWCDRSDGRPLVRVRGVVNPWGGRIAAHAGGGVSCRDWVAVDWLVRHPDLRKATR